MSVVPDSQDGSSKIYISHYIKWLLIVLGQDERSFGSQSGLSDDSEGSEELEGYEKYTAGTHEGIAPDELGDPDVANENTDARANVQIRGDFE